MKKIFVLVVLLLAVPCMAFAKMDLDLRFKGGAAAGLDEMNIDPLIHATGSDDDSRNLQLELAFVPLARRAVSPLFTVGFFDRRHSGTVSDLFMGIATTAVDYNARGITFGAGVRFMASSNLHFEGRIEAGAGEGKPDLSTPGFLWNPVKEKAYASWSLIVGSYYTFSIPRIQLGLEVGAQSFAGDFQILNNSGYWYDADVTGGGGIINATVGYRF